MVLYKSCKKEQRKKEKKLMKSVLKLKINQSKFKDSRINFTTLSNKLKQQRKRWKITKTTKILLIKS